MEVFASITAFPRFNAEEERILSEKAKGGDLDARNQLVLSNIPWAVECAKQCAVSVRSQLDDCISTAMMALVVATDALEPELGRLSTLVRVCVYNAIVHGDLEGPIRVRGGWLGEGSMLSPELRRMATLAVCPVNIQNVIERPVMVDPGQRDPAEFLESQETDRIDSARIDVMMEKLLSDRQYEIMSGYRNGISSEDMAETLGISPNGVMRSLRASVTIMQIAEKNRRLGTEEEEREVSDENYGHPYTSPTARTED
jgi:RNA polymerase sigma factor (sigma-70 family)